MRNHVLSPEGKMMDMSTTEETSVTENTTYESRLLLETWEQATTADWANYYITNTVRETIKLGLQLLC